MAYPVPQATNFDTNLDEQIDTNYGISPDNYEPIDLTAIYFPIIIPPQELVEAWEKIHAMYDTMYGITERKIGNTWYTILTSCDGSERLIDKVKRLIFSEPVTSKISTKEALAG